MRTKQEYQEALDRLEDKVNGSYLFEHNYNEEIIIIKELIDNLKENE